MKSIRINIKERESDVSYIKTRENRRNNLFIKFFKVKHCKNLFFSVDFSFASLAKKQTSFIAMIAIAIEIELTVKLVVRLITKSTVLTPNGYGTNIAVL